METRKVIAFGKSTLSITLPKKWTTKTKLKKGDLLVVTELPTGKLELSLADQKEHAEPKKISIPIANRPLREVQREFIAAYIKGYSVIDLVGDHQGKLSEIRRRLHELIAVEIMEVTHNRITAKVFSDMSLISFPNILSRIVLITRTIMEETQAIVPSAKNLHIRYRELVEKKREVDRQSLFALRITLNALSDPVFAAQVEPDHKKLSFIWYWQIIDYLEKVSDYLLGIAFYLTSTDVLQKLGKSGRTDLARLFDMVGKTFSSAVIAYNKKSIPLANKAFDAHTRADKSLYTIYRKYETRWIPVIVGYLRRTSSKSRDIAKVTINMNTK